MNSVSLIWRNAISILACYCGVVVIAGIVITGCSRQKNFNFNVQSVNERTCEISNTALVDAFQNATTGNAYLHNSEKITVMQVIQGQGVLAISLHDGSVVFIKTQRDYVDGNTIFPGLYVCVGSVSYANAKGTICTVRVFDEMDEATAKKRIEKLEQERLDAEIKRKKLEAAAQLEREKQALKEREMAEKVAEEERKAMAELEKQRKELERLEMERKAQETIRKQKEREEAEAKEREEKARRYPEEQRRFKEYAASKLNDMKFDIRQYFKVQPALRKYIHSAKPTESMWEKLRVLQSKQDWLGMLNSISQEQLTDFPDTNQIDALVSALADKEFHVEFRWTHKFLTVDVYDIYLNNPESGTVLHRIETDSDDPTYLIVPFTLAQGNPHYVYYPGNGMYGFRPLRDLESKFNEKRDQILKSYELGRFDVNERDKRLADLGNEKVRNLMRQVGNSQIKLHQETENERIENLSGPRVNPWEMSGVQSVVANGVGISTTTKEPAKTDSESLESNTQKVFIKGFRDYKFGSLAPKSDWYGLEVKNGRRWQTKKVSFKKFEELELGYAVSNHKLCALRFQRAFPELANRAKLNADVQELKDMFERQVKVKMSKDDELHYVYEDDTYKVEIKAEKGSKTITKTVIVGLNVEKSAQDVGVITLYFEMTNKAVEIEGLSR